MPMILPRSSTKAKEDTLRIPQHFVGSKIAALAQNRNNSSILSQFKVAAIANLPITRSSNALAPNIAKTATRKIDYYSKKDKGKPHAVHHVLADLCTQLDDTLNSEANENGEDNDVEVFQAILSDNSPQILDPEETSKAVSNIYVIDYDHASNREDEFLGACINSAAQKTVVVKPQAELYSQRCGIPFRLEYSNSPPRFRFGSHRHTGLGKIEIRVLISTDHFLLLKVDVVNIDIPFLLGLDTMRAYSMVLDTEEIRLSSKFDGWKVPLVQKHGHFYYEWDIQIFFTEMELRKIHRHFFHPKPEKIYSLIRIADPETASPKVLQDLERIDATFDPCQRFGTAHRFKVSLPSGDIVFNREVCVDLMSLNHRTVLHAVDRDTKFNAARFLKDESAETAWNTFREMWVSTYVGYQDIVSADQGPQFRSKYWFSAAKLAGIELKLSGVESHNALNVRETYHEFLRRIFNKVSAENPEICDEDLLVLSNKALNDTAGPNGLVPTLLVFGILPRILFVPKELPAQVQRMKAIDSARVEVSKLVATSKLKLALKAKTPGSADSGGDLQIGSEVLVFREKPINKWTGPFKVLDIDGTLDMNGKQTKYSIDKLKLYHRSPSRKKVRGDAEPDPTNSDTQVQRSSGLAIESEVGPLTQLEREPRHLSDHEAEQRHPLGDADVIDRWKDTFADIQDDEIQKDVKNLEDLQLDDVTQEDLFGEEAANIDITKALPPNDPREDSIEFDKAKNEEIEGMKKRDLWDIISREKIPEDANILGGRFVLAYKNHGTPNEVVRARYVAQGHSDKEKGFVVHNVTTLRGSSVRVFVSVASIKGFKICGDDVRQAYLQNEDQLTRDIYLLPKPKDRKFFDLENSQILKLKKLIYGIADAGDYWGVLSTTTLRQNSNSSLSLETLHCISNLLKKTLMV